MVGLSLRAEEGEALSRAWRAAVDGVGHVLILLGDAGIGKTTTLRWFADSIGTSAHVIRCRGGDLAPPMSVAAELAEVLGCEHHLPWCATNPDPLKAADVLRTGLEACDSKALLIDDIHAADPSSRTALNLALRRAVLGSTLVVVAGRRAPTTSAFAEGFAVRELRGLPADAAAELLALSSDTPVHHTVSRRLVEAASGNPLALTNLPHALSAAQLAGSEPLPRELPLVGDLAAVFARQLPPVGTAARELLDRVVICPEGAWSQSVATNHAIDELLDRGLLDVDGPRLSLRHPLLRNAVFGAMSERRRRALNLEFADDLELPDDVRILHRASGTVGTDELLVDRMVDTARRMRAEHGLECAARILEHAIPLTSDNARRGWLLLEAGELLGAAGDAAGARRCLEEVVAGPRWRELKVAAAMSLATLEAVDGAPVAAQQRLSECLAVADPDQAAAVYCRMAIPLGMLGAVRQLYESAQQAVERAAPTQPSVVSDVATVIFAHAASAMDEGRSNDMVDAFDALDLNAAVRADPLVGLHVGRAMSIAERYDEATVRLTTSIADLKSDGARASLAMLYGALGETFVRASRFDEARVSLGEAVALSLATGQRAFAPFWLSLRARVAGIAGDDSAAQRDLDLGFAISDEQATFGARYFLLANAGLVALIARRYDAAAELLGECWAFEHATGDLTPQLARWHVDLVDAYTALERSDEAESIVRHLEDIVDARAVSRWTRATSLRARALVCADDRPRAAKLLHAALATYDRRDDAFDCGRALTELARVAVTRDEREWAAAQARYVFRRIGAPALAVAADHPRGAGIDALTNAERRVLDEVAIGLTNDQIARRLHLSTKTVANHLYRIYRKLGVTSRTEATRQLLLHDGHRE